MGKTHANVLLINSTSINRDTSASITMRNCFSKWPKESLMEVYFGDGAEKVISDGVNGYAIPVNYFPFKYVATRKLFKKMNSSMKSVAPSGTTNQGQPKRTWKSYVREWLALTVSNSFFVFPQTIYQEIVDFNPSYIYTIGESFLVMNLAVKISKKLNIPIVPHFMDNWQEAIEWQDNPLLKGYKKKLDRSVKKLYERTDEALGISQRMCEVYSSKWKVPHYPLMNTVNIELYNSAVKKISDKIEFLYAGGLHLNRWDALNKIGLAIDEVTQQIGTECTFKIYTSIENINRYRACFTAKSIVLEEAVKYEEMPRLYQEADVLVHAETDSLMYDTFAKYSLTTKLPEYLISNRPFLYWGPDSLFLTEFLAGRDLCYYAKADTELVDVIKTMLRDEQTRNQKMKNAREAAINGFSTEYSEKTLKKIMRLKE